MTTELERTKEALAVALDAVNELRHMGVVHQSRPTDIKDFAQETHERVNAILNPPPILEEVEEIVGWVNVYQRGDTFVAPEVFRTEEDANHPYNVGAGRISCQPIRVTVKREKKRPVERSVTVDGHIDEFGDAFGPDIDGEMTDYPFRDHPELCGKSVKLTAIYTEDPTT